MNKRVYLVHGWAGTPRNHWFNWLIQQLVERDIECHSIEFPNPKEPKAQVWYEKLQDEVTNPDTDTFLIGHSLGCITILRFLEQLPVGKKIGGAILIAGFSRPLPRRNIEEAERVQFSPFMTPPLDYENVKEKSLQFVAIHSDNDEVPLEEGEVLRDKIGATLEVVHNAGHFCRDDGYKEFPLVLNTLMTMMKGSDEKEN